MAAKVNDRNVLPDPIIKFLYCSLLFDIVDVALFQRFLNDTFFFEVVNLVIDFVSLGVQHRLAVKKQERRCFLRIRFLVDSSSP